jgi:hypothetical protein
MMPGSVHRHHRRQVHLDGLDAAVHLADHPQRLPGGLELEARLLLLLRLALQALLLGGEGGLRQPEPRRQPLAGLVLVVVDRLLAHEHQVRPLLLDHLLQDGRDHHRVEGAVVADQHGPIGAHGQRGPQLGLRLLDADGGHHHLAAVGLLEPQRLLDGDLVEGVELVVHAVGDDAGTVRLHSDLRLRILDALHGHEELQGHAVAPPFRRGIRGREYVPAPGGPQRPTARGWPKRDAGCRRSRPAVGLSKTSSEGPGVLPG